jgi:hypothetical protein
MISKSKLKQLRKDPRGIPLSDATRPNPSRNKIEWIPTENAAVVSVLREILEERKQIKARMK